MLVAGAVADTFVVGLAVAVAIAVGFVVDVGALAICCCCRMLLVIPLRLPLLIPCADDVAVVSAAVAVAAVAVAAVDDVYCFCSTGVVVAAAVDEVYCFCSTDVVVAAAVVSIVDIFAMVVAFAVGARVVDAEDDIIGTISCCCRLLLVSIFDCVCKNSVRKPEDQNRQFPRRKMSLFTRPR